MTAVSGSYQVSHSASASISCVVFATFALTAGMKWVSDDQIHGHHRLADLPQAPIESYGVSSSRANRFEEAKSSNHIIDEFASFEDDWDGYHGSAISKQACDNARSFIGMIEAAPLELSMPDISPKPAGTISFAWESPYGEAYFEVGDDLYSGIIKSQGRETTYLRGRVDEIGHQIATLIYVAIAPPVMHSAPVTEIVLHARNHEQAAA